MPYIQPTDGGGMPVPPPLSPRQPTPRRRASSGRRAPRSRSTSVKPAKAARTATTPTPRPTVSATTGAPLGAAGDPWQAQHAGGIHPAPTLDLTAGAGLGSVILELVGADHATLGSALGAWQREQDRLLNRAWRRPGGLARPGGL